MDPSWGTGFFKTGLFIISTLFPIFVCLVSIWPFFPPFLLLMGHYWPKVLAIYPSAAGEVNCSLSCHKAHSSGNEQTPVWNLDLLELLFLSHTITHPLLCQGFWARSLMQQNKTYVMGHLREVKRFLRILDCNRTQKWWVIVWGVSSSASHTAHIMIPTKLVLSLWFINLHVNSEPFFNFTRDILTRRHSDFPLLPAQITSGKPCNLKPCTRNTYCIFQKPNKNAFINVCLGLP